MSRRLLFKWMIVVIVVVAVLIGCMAHSVGATGSVIATARTDPSGRSGLAEVVGSLATTSTTTLTTPMTTMATTTTKKPPLKIVKKIPTTVIAKPSSGALDIEHLRVVIGTCESGMNYQSKNAHSTASGIAQWLDSTWNGYGGYRRAYLAPSDVQDRRFREDLSLGWAHVRSEWAASHYCWGPKV